MTLTWLGHSCFLVQSQGYQIVLDPYAPDSVPGYLPVCAEADQVLCSHEHRDHHGVEQVTLRQGGTSPFTIETISTWHDDQQGALLVIVPGGDGLNGKGGSAALTQGDLLHAVVVPVLVAAQHLVGLGADGQIARYAVGSIGVQNNLVSLGLHQEAGVAQPCECHIEIPPN